MTNPNNAVGTPAAFSGRTSVKAFNNITGAFSRGIISGWGCAPVSGLTVAVGGTAGIRDIAVAEDANGNRTTISNISEAPIEVAMGASPATYNRIDAIVAYVEPSPTGDNSTQDNPVACGIIPVAGTAAANPVQPTDAQIRSAITTDGGTGTSAYYAVLAIIQRTPGQTSIASGNISKAPASKDTTMDPIDITSEITLSGGYVHVMFTLTGKHLTFTYQGDSRNWASGDLIFVVPAKYLPKGMATLGQYFMVGAINATAMTCCVRSDGQMVINNISGPTTGRPYIAGGWDIA